MIIPSADIAETLSTMESIKSYLVGLVDAAFDSRAGEPVRLTYVGGEFAKTVGVPFEKHVTALAERNQIAVPKTRRKLAPFVEAYCDDIFKLIKDPAGVYFVSPLSRGEGSAPRPGVAHTPAALRFHRAIWAAFIRPLEGKRRFLNLEKLGFTDAGDRPEGANWQEIEERFILGLASGAPVDGSELQARIEEWARNAGVPISHLVIGAKPPRERSRQLEQLFEIIDALPTPLAASWSIPAAVLKHLRNAG